MNIEVFKVNREGTKYELKCTPSEGYELVAISFSRTEPTDEARTRSVKGFNFTTDETDPEIAAEIAAGNTILITNEDYSYSDPYEEGHYNMPPNAPQYNLGGIKVDEEFIYAKITERVIGGTTLQSKVVCTFYTGRIIDELMTCIDSIPDGDGGCNNISRFNNLYMKFKAVELCIRNSDFDKAQKYFNKFFTKNSPRARGGCNCHA